MSQREISLAQLTATRASGAVVLIRLYVGLIFVGEGVLKFLRPDALGPGRFDKAGDSRLDLLRLLRRGVRNRLRRADSGRPADQVGGRADDRRHDRRAAITKLPILWGNAPLYPKEGGFWDFFHEGRLEVAMLCGSVFLLIVGAGAYSFDQPDEPRRQPRTCHRCSGLATHTAISKVDSRTVTGDREPE